MISSIHSFDGLESHWPRVYIELLNLVFLRFCQGESGCSLNANTHHIRTGFNTHICWLNADALNG